MGLLEKNFVLGANRTLRLKTLIEFEKSNPKQKEIYDLIGDFRTKELQFDEEKALFQLQFFSNFTTAGPSKKTQGIINCQTLSLKVFVLPH